MRFNKDLKIVIYDAADGKLIFKPFGYHKLLLAAFGFLLDSGEGFIAGFIIGCIFDCKWTPTHQAPKHADLRLNYLMLGAFILQASGVEMKLSPDTIRQRLVKQFGEAYVEKRFTFFRELLRQRIQVEAICDSMRNSIPEKEKISIIQFLYELSVHTAADYNKLNAAIFYIGGRMNVDTNAVKQLAAKYTAGRRTHSTSSQNGSNKNAAPSANDPYSILGVQHNCDLRELKKAYHSMAKKYHPDAHPGISAAEKNKMMEKFRLITEAYETIKEEHGWN